MKAVAHVSLGFMMVLAMSLAANAPLVLTDRDRDAVLWDHNQMRRTLATPVANNMLLLRYDLALEQTAQNYLIKTNCKPSTFNHNAARSTEYVALGGVNGRYVGENWYSGGPTNSTTPIEKAFGGATRAWTNNACSSASFSGNCVSQGSCSEMAYFYSTNGCTGTFSTWGHFSQVMWATTAYVGCGYTVQCGTLCNYASGGNININGPVPSVVWGVGGAAASKCPTSAPFNDNGLCSTINAPTPPFVAPTTLPLRTSSTPSSTSPSSLPLRSSAPSSTSSSSLPLRSSTPSSASFSSLPLRTSSTPSSRTSSSTPKMKSSARSSSFLKFKSTARSSSSPKSKSTPARSSSSLKFKSTSASTSTPSSRSPKLSDASDETSSLATTDHAANTEPMATGAVVGIVLSVLVGATVLSVAVFWFLKRRRAHSSQAPLNYIPQYFIKVPSPTV